MCKNPVLWIVLVTLAAAPLGAEERTATLSVDEIIARNVETRGGLDAIKAIESAYLTGTISMGGLQTPFTIEYLRPHKVRVEITIQGMTIIQAYNGETGWAVMPLMGKTGAEPMAEDQLKQIKARSDMIEGELIDYADKGYQVELVGKEDVEGTEAYKLKITRDDGEIVYSYLDTEYFLQFRREAKTNVMGQESNSSISIGDYKEVGDIIMAHSIETTLEGAPVGQVMSINSVELGADIADERFAMPALPE